MTFNDEGTCRTDKIDAYVGRIQMGDAAQTIGI